MANILEMLSDCDSVKNIASHNGGPSPAFDSWEKKFLREAIEEFDNNQTLEKKKLEKLKEMWNRI